ncbi:hypothetical protein F2P56_011614 [Juglans regia]|uniref:Uncharacterized protein LOC108982564 n=2 Tax=Juglans regia TaxID=51240 RepID=A0A2I4DQU4_JUGRE|nr:uncharacterized protein LOC108982564 [Juglans regia]KAF5471152.1 hypothetical protein F2P56_011614 [Juglans regia]
MSITWMLMSFCLLKVTACWIEKAKLGSLEARKDKMARVKLKWLLLRICTFRDRSNPKEETNGRSTPMTENNVGSLTAGSKTLFSMQPSADGMMPIGATPVWKCQGFKVPTLADAKSFSEYRSFGYSQSNNLRIISLLVAAITHLTCGLDSLTPLDWFAGHVSQPSVSQFPRHHAHQFPLLNDLSPSSSSISALEANHRPHPSHHDLNPPEEISPQALVPSVSLEVYQGWASIPYGSDCLVFEEGSLRSEDKLRSTSPRFLNISMLSCCTSVAWVLGGDGAFDKLDTNGNLYINRGKHSDNLTRENQDWKRKDNVLLHEYEAWKMKIK